MKIIITGGTGLIGRALAKNLAQDGHQAILLSRRHGQTAGLTPGMQVEHWDGRSAQGWGALADGADAIVNLAGENISAGRWTAQRKQAILESRVNAGAAVVEAIRQAARKPGVLIQSSAVGYYGSSETQVFTEDAPAAGDFLGRVCQAWEASTQAVEALGVRRAIARTSVVLDAHAGALPRMLLPFKLFAGGPLGSGQQWLSWAHITDQVRALRFLIETPQAEGAFNISAAPLTNRQFAQVLGKITHRPSFVPAPAFAIRLAFGEMSSVVLEGQRVSSKRLADLGFQYRFPEAEAALADLLKR
ncbi:MAG TPA: TIGR01777 family oxidoreductase [Anaerolineales bacterium]|nr:TIGR01777 family oxidoreductase [Anaerolineales bacterium]